jgi:hypothetical protein
MADGKYQVTVEMSAEEMQAVQTLLDELIHVDFFSKLPYGCYSVLEKFIMATISEIDKEKTRKDIAARFDNVQSWAYDRCDECKHEAKEHALAGTGLCCREACQCMKFKPQSKING